MTKTKLLAGAAALALTTGIAFADDNVADSSQSGSDNDVLIEQNSGSLNEAAIEQDGDGNDTNILQTGDRNIAARTSAPLLQDGDDNEIDVVQSGNVNRVGTRGFRNDQLGDGNVLDVDQTSNSNTVGEFRQESTASTGGSNTLTILQEGGDRNFVGTAFQTNTGGSDNTGDIAQSGARNYLDSLSQTGSDNTINAEFTGDRNGADGATIGNPAVGSLSGVAAATGAASSALTQDGAGNMIDLLITGDDNQFGVSQTGNDNTVGTLTVTGNDNDLGIVQGDATSGDRNEVALGTVEGDGNNIGVLQTNDDNFAQIDLIGFSDDNVVDIEQQGKFGGSGNAVVSIEGTFNGGDNNAVEILQQSSGDAMVGINGDRNDVRVRQFNTEIANITIGSGSGEGDGNFLDVVQANGTGSNPNSVTVEIYGDDNNRGSFTGDAFTVGDAFSSEGGGLSFNGLNAGEIDQGRGNGNSVNITVGSLTDEADDNLFAVGQRGSSNSVMGTIMGTANQAVVTQIGNMNTASFMQMGNGNNMGISQ